MGKPAGRVRFSFIPPVMPTLVEKPPEGDRWIHEVKFDGYHSQIIIDDEGVRIFTRRGLDWTSQYRDLAKAAGELGVESAIIDGEIIVLNEAGLSDFGELRKAITRRQHDLYFVAFDLLHLNSHDLRDMPLEDRCEILAETHPIQRSSAGHRRRGLSPCRSSRAWGRGVETQGQPVSKRDFDKLAEAKCHAIGEFDLLGVEREPGKPAFALLAERGTGRYVGSAFITLNREMR